MSEAVVGGVGVVVGVGVGGGGVGFVVIGVGVVGGVKLLDLLKNLIRRI